MMKKQLAAGKHKLIHLRVLKLHFWCCEYLAYVGHAYFLEYSQLRILFLQNNSDSNWQMFSGFPNAYCRKNVELNYNLIAGHNFFQVIRDFFQVYSCWLPLMFWISLITLLFDPSGAQFLRHVQFALLMITPGY